MTAVLIIAVSVLLAFVAKLTFDVTLRPYLFGAWYITGLGGTATLGPFISEAKARRYPDTFSGFVDAPFFRHPHRVLYRPGRWGRVDPAGLLPQAGRLPQLGDSLVGHYLANGGAPNAGTLAILAEADLGRARREASR